MPQVLAFTADLIFASRITGAARALGLSAASAASPDAAAQAMCDQDLRLVVVDMSAPLESACAALRSAAAHPAGPRTVAYYSHVETAQRDAARQAGAEHVMPRSQFVRELPNLVAAVAG